ncbi:MAG: hypothetical protein ACM3ON_07030 [Chloroflexota bacterium]
MAQGSKRSKKSILARTLLLGALSATLYGVLLESQGVITEYFTKGSLYAFLPIGTAFLFSIVHGSFTGNFWTVLGVEASKKRKEVK